MSKKTDKTRRFAAIDAMIVILLLVCIACVGVRMAVGRGGLLSADGQGEYLVSYVVSAIDGEYSDCFAEGKKFYLEDKSEFGTLTAGASFTPAKHYTENADGLYTAVYVTDGTVDVRGTALVKGVMTDSGFLLGRSRYIAANSTLTVSSSEITVNITVTDITKAQK